MQEKPRIGYKAPMSDQARLKAALEGTLPPIDDEDEPKKLPRNFPESVKVRIRSDWPVESRVIHALVRRLGGFAALTADELEPKEVDGLIIHSRDNGLNLSSDTFFCRPPEKVVDRYRNDIQFCNLCNCLEDMVRKGQFSVVDLLDAIGVVRVQMADDKYFEQSK